MIDAQRSEAGRLLARLRWTRDARSSCRVCGVRIEADSRYRDYCGQAHYRRAWRARRKQTHATLES